jgi:hypothetical protein
MQLITNHNSSSNAYFETEIILLFYAIIMIWITLLEGWLVLKINMKKIRIVSRILAVSTLIITIGYFILVNFFDTHFPFPIYLVVRHIYEITLAICLLVVFPAIIFSTTSVIIRVLTIFIAFPLWCSFSYIAIEPPEQIKDSSEMGNQHYYFTAGVVYTESYTFYSIYKCNNEGLNCAKIFTNTRGSGMDKVALIQNEKSDEIYGLEQDYLVFADGIQTHEIVESEEFGNIIYYIGIYTSNNSIIDQKTYLFYQCDDSLKSCQQLPFRYIDTSDRYASGPFLIEFDNFTKEIRVLQNINSNYVLIYSLGSKPKCFVDNCTIPN